MQDDAEAPPQFLQIPLPHIHAVHQNLAALHVVEAQQEARERGLAGAGVADYCDGLARLDRQLNVPEDPILLFVREPNIAKLDPPGLRAGCDGRNGLRRRLDCDRRVEQLEDALGAGHGALQNIVLIAEVLDGLEEALGILNKSHQDADGQSRPEHLVAAVPENQRHCGGTQHLHRGIKQRVGVDGIEEGNLVGCVDAVELLETFFLAVEELHYAHAGDVLGEVRVDARDGHPDAPVAIPHPPPEDHGGEYDKRQNGKRNQSQLPVHLQHHDDDEQQREEIAENGHHPGREHFVQHIHVGGDARDQPAHRIAVVELERQAVQVPEQLQAQIEHGALPDHLHGVSLHVLQDE